uniref:Uncharacterized protein n=1 Tax=Arcella intermedia TaxID=1963864 RepID=A0A6B2LUK7_9EUKA
MDWDSREWVSSITTDILRISSFLNKFESNVQASLAKINDKLVQLERQMDFLEARYLTVPLQEIENDNDNDNEDAELSN